TEARASVGTWLVIVAIAIASVPVVALPVVFVAIALVETWVAELVAAAVARIYYRLRPEKRRPVNTPHILGPVTST
ncbi:MAG: hypothetical protein ACR2JF_04135, partial [Iamia sp.]